MTKSADLVTFTEEILNGKLHFLCSVNFFLSQRVSVMTDVNYGVAMRLLEHPLLKHMLIIHSICHRVALTCTDSSS